MQIKCPQHKIPMEIEECNLNVLGTVYPAIVGKCPACQVRHITFDPDNQFIELITKPVSVQAKVWRYADEKQWEVKESLEDVQIASLRVTPFGANITYDPKPDAVGISPRLGKTMEDAICAVMKDGSRIKLDLSGNNDTVLQAETPIVLSQLDSILLEDGTAIPVLYTPKEARQAGPSGIE